MCFLWKPGPSFPEEAVLSAFMPYHSEKGIEKLFIRHMQMLSLLGVSPSRCFLAPLPRLQMDILHSWIRMVVSFTPYNCSLHSIKGESLLNCHQLSWGLGNATTIKREESFSIISSSVSQGPISTTTTPPDISLLNLEITLCDIYFTLPLPPYFLILVLNVNGEPDNICGTFAFDLSPPF